MEFGKRRDTTDTTDVRPRQLVTDLSFMLRTCYRLVVDLLRTCYGETGVMDFGLNNCRQVSDSDHQPEVASLAP